MNYEIHVNGARRSVALARPEDRRAGLVAMIDGRQVEAHAAQLSPGVWSVLLDGRSFEIHIEAVGESLLVQVGDREFRMEIADPRSWRRGRGGRLELEGRQQICAPMPGKIVRVLVTQGQRVEAGQGLFVVEAMKMQNEVRSPRPGTIERVMAGEGQAVNAGEVLAVVA